MEILIDVSSHEKLIAVAAKYSRLLLTSKNIGCLSEQKVL